MSVLKGFHARCELDDKAVYGRVLDECECGERRGGGGNTSPHCSIAECQSFNCRSQAARLRCSGSFTLFACASCHALLLSKSSPHVHLIQKGSSNTIHIEHCNLSRRISQSAPHIVKCISSSRRLKTEWTCQRRLLKNNEFDMWVQSQLMSLRLRTLSKWGPSSCIMKSSSRNDSAMWYFVAAPAASPSLNRSFPASRLRSAAKHRSC